MKKTIMTSEDIILLHIYRNRSHLEDRRLPFAVCREGIRESKGLSMADVKMGVQSLVYSGLVIFEKRYVETKRWPCLAYSLTPLGEFRAKVMWKCKAEDIRTSEIRTIRVNDTDLLRRRDNALKVKAKMLRSLKRDY
jgi:hypothetical protein